MPLRHLTVILILIVEVRRVVTSARRRPTSHRRLAGAIPLGGLCRILSVLCPFLATRVHLEIREME
jgi:hypothetical protein